MYVCRYVSMYVCTDIYIYNTSYDNAPPYLYISIYGCTCKHMYIVYIYIHVYVYVHVYVQTEDASDTRRSVWAFFWSGFFRPRFMAQFRCLLVWGRIIVQVMWSHIRNVATSPYASSTPPHDIGSHLGLCVRCVAEAAVFESEQPPRSLEGRPLSLKRDLMPSMRNRITFAGTKHVLILQIDRFQQFRSFLPLFLNVDVLRPC